MHKITSNIYYIGASSKPLQEKLFEAHFNIEHGMAYNSYLIDDEKITIIDACDKVVVDTWIKNILEVLGDRKPTYLIVQHVEPDHSFGVRKLMELYPDIVIVGSEMTMRMLSNYFRDIEFRNKLIIKEGDELSLGQHSLKFIFAPMVHWPEVFFSYEQKENILFSADAFGKFGAFDYNENWDDEARRYYFGIVGKYGMQVANVFTKIKDLNIKQICSLHGPILNKDLDKYLNLYKHWATYTPEVDGVFIPYTSVYGHTEEAVKYIEKLLNEKGIKVEIANLSTSDLFSAVANCFKYSKIIFATTTYNMSIFPYMNELLICLAERNFQNRIVGLVENGSWALNASKIMKEKLDKMKDVVVVEPGVHILSSLSNKNKEEINSLLEALLK